MAKTKVKQDQTSQDLFYAFYDSLVDAMKEREKRTNLADMQASYQSSIDRETAILDEAQRKFVELLSHMLSG